MSTTSYAVNEDDINLSRIDEELERLKTGIERLAAISKLPSELLLEIMLAYKYHYEVGDGAKGSKEFQGIPCLEATYRWVVISHVCRHWRAVALSSPLFWTSIHIPRVSPRQVLELLRRSHPAPISLNLHRTLAEEELASGLSPLLDDGGVERSIQCLRLRYPRGNTSCLTRLPLHNLKEFALRCERERSETADYHSFLDHVTASSSNLTSLALMHVALDKRLLHETLTTLSLSNSKIEGNTRWDEFLSTLASMKHLKHLYFDEFLSKLRPSDVNEPTSISLPCLDSLTLVNDAAEIHIRFLESVSFPPEVAINLRNHVGSLEAFAASIPSFPQAFASSPSRPYQFLALTIWGYAPAGFLISIGLHHDIPRYDGGNLQYPRMLQCRVGFAGGSFSFETFMKSVDEFTQSLPLMHIRHLRLECNRPEYFPPQLLQTFAALSDVHTLDLWETPDGDAIAHALASALPQCHSECSNSATVGPSRSRSSLCVSCKSFSKTWFPRLQKLEFRRCWSDEDRDKHKEVMEKLSCFGYDTSSVSPWLVLSRTTNTLTVLMDVGIPSV